MYLDIHNIAKQWMMPIRGLKPALNRLLWNLPSDLTGDHKSLLA